MSGTSQPTPQWALYRIHQARERRLTALNLSALPLWEKLVVVPPELLTLTWLQDLDLSGNRLTTLSDTFAQLSNLRSLNLSRNRLTVVPDAIIRLVNLQTLYLSYNQLTDIPAWLIELPQLKKLCLNDNYIEVPPLELLQIEGIWETKQSAETGKIWLYLPVDLAKLRAYFRQMTEVGVDHLFEAKLLIVGEPGAGKTSLACKIIDPVVPLPSSDETTKGIDVHTWTFPFIPASPISQSSYPSFVPAEFRVNIWDFGGQEILHTTHQFFLTRRSLYIVVADTREQKTDFYYWLDSIEHLSNASPVLIFNNERENWQWAIDERKLRHQFANLKDVFAFNLLTDHRGIEQLRQAIQYYITQLSHVGDVLPATWLSVRRALEDDSRPYISLYQFLDLCGQYGITRYEDKLQISSYLHDLGVILHFQDEPLLKKMVILQPEWGVDAVYRVLGNNQVNHTLGRFGRADLGNIWQEERYANMHDELLALMMKFQLCYEIPTQPGQYIAPQLLSEQQPVYDWSSENNLHLRYKYEEFMPRGLVTRFIVVMHPYIVGQQLVWRNGLVVEGVVVEKDNTRAEIIEYSSRREIRIRVSGVHKRDLLTIIIHEMDKLHRPFHQLKYDHLIPCNCDSCHSSDDPHDPHFYKMEDLKIRLEHGKQDIECNQPPFHTVNIWSLIDDVGARAQVSLREDQVAFADVPELLEQLIQVFSEEELRTLCLELGVGYDDLPAQGRNNKAREFILYLERRGRLVELVELVRRERPHLHL